ncbi:hypothetical protein ES707_10550 [subsurface metagenome]
MVRVFMLLFIMAMNPVPYHRPPGSSSPGSANTSRPTPLAYRHALLTATTIESQIDTIVTEDAHLLRIPGITVVNPYREG